MSRPDPISIRLPPELKSRLEAASNEAGRSMNAEIRMRLEHTFETGFSGEPTEKMLANEVESIRIEMRAGQHQANEMIAELKRRLNELEKIVRK